GRRRGAAGRAPGQPAHLDPARPGGAAAHAGGRLGPHLPDHLQGGQGADPHPGLSNTARTGLWAWAKTAAADLADDNITLNLACPGTHDTERARQAGLLGDGPVGDPADFGKVVCFLCSDPARFVSGAALQVDGATSTGLL
ncbi:MAG TPA: SDR family oxidoreductase, partial [Actinomycetes bacterium]|nr:SDR family oxidoreductase [Actinomycetes bacterium]